MNEKAAERTRTVDLRFTKPLLNNPVMAASRDSATTWGDDSRLPADTSSRFNSTQQQNAPEIDPQLQLVMTAWPSLPEPVRAGIGAMISALVGMNVKR